MKVTLKTIAEEAGLSITTVSRALAGYDDVNKATRQRVIAIAERLSYQPNLTARHLRSKQTYTIGMVIPLTAYFSDPFFMELLSGVGRKASEYGYDLLLSAQQPGEEELSAYRRMVASSRIDGMVVARVGQDDPRLAFLQEARHPFVAFGHSDTATYPYIDVDGTAGMRDVVLHLARLGHTRIALILPPLELAFAQARREGYLQGLCAANLTPDPALIVQGDLTQESGYAAACHLLAQTPPPTAIAACNDMMAIGAMQAIQELGLQVGRDIAVTGFDDVLEASRTTPPLTTVRQPIYAIGQQATEMLIRVIRHESLEAPQVLLTPQLIIRESCGHKEQGGEP